MQTIVAKTRETAAAGKFGHQFLQTTTYHRPRVVDDANCDAARLRHARGAASVEKAATRSSFRSSNKVVGCLAIDLLKSIMLAPWFTLILERGGIDEFLDASDVAQQVDNDGFDVGQDQRRQPPLRNMVFRKALSVTRL
jgi:hypothetical protein